MPTAVSPWGGAKFMSVSTGSWSGQKAHLASSCVDGFLSRRQLLKASTMLATLSGRQLFLSGRRLLEASTMLATLSGRRLFLSRRRLLEVSEMLATLSGRWLFLSAYCVTIE